MYSDQLAGSFFGPSNLVDLLIHRADHQGRDVGFSFLVDGETESIHLTYEQLDRQARLIGMRLRELGLEGHRALLLYPSGLDFVTAFFGCLYAGVVAVPAYPPRRNRNMIRVEAIAQDADARIALTIGSELERVQAMIDQDSRLASIDWLATDTLDTQDVGSWEKPDVHADTLAFLQYTSGSTGAPKGVMLSHGNLMHNSAMIAYAFEHTRSGHGVFWLPLYHDMGLIGGILQPLYVGRPNTLMSPAAFLQKPLRWLQTISRDRATVSGGPNFAYDLCVDKISEAERAHLDLSSWSVAFNGAEPIRPETIRRFVEAFEPCGFRKDAFYPCYGLAEATLIVSGGLKMAPPVIRAFDTEAIEQHEVVEALPDEDGAKELVGCGGNLLDQQILIVDPQTCQRCPANQVGEIWVAGPSVAGGYWNRPEVSADTFGARLAGDSQGEYLRTGDLGFIADGELFVTGRLKDLIILRGVNYYPQDIEFTVESAHKDLRSAAGAAFVVEKDGDQKLVVAQEIARRRDIDFDEIAQKIRQAIAVEHELSIDEILLLRAGSIPKTSSGKIQRHACKRGYLNDSLAVVSQWPSVPQEAAGVDSVVAKGTAQKNGAIASPTRRPALPAVPANTPTAIDGVREKESPVAEAIYEVVRGIARERAQVLTPETNILELGLDSLERIEIITALEDRFGGRLPTEILPDLETCQQVIDAVETHLGGVPREKSERPQGYEADSAQFKVEEFPEYRALRENFHLVEQAGLKNPYFTVHEGITNDRTQIGGREYINFCSYNYLGMSGDPSVTRAAQEAADKFGTSVSASRLVSGEKPVHRQLEQGIAEFIGVEDSIVLVGGHATNETTIGHLLGPGDLILHDSLAHNSILQGSVLSGARRRQFPHNDFRTCEKLLEEMRHEYRRVLIVIEGVYSMDGDMPDLPEFVEIKKKHHAMLMVDEAHSIGTMGLHGRGVSEHFQVNPRDVDIWMGTLSKSFGSCGGYIAGSKALVELLKYTAPGFVYSVGIPPANAAAALASLRLLEEEPQRVERLHRNSKLFLELAQQRGFNVGTSDGTPVVPVITGNSKLALGVSQWLFEQGINVQPIMYPAVEESAARLRFFITCTHTEEQIRETVDKVADAFEQLAPEHVRQEKGMLQPIEQPAMTSH